MKEVSNHPQGDSMAAAIDKYDGAANSMAADAWSGRVKGLDRQDVRPSDENVKCIVITDLYGNLSKECYKVPQDMPGKPGAVNSAENPIVKPEIPADGGLKDPIKVPSLDGGLKDPIKDIVKDPIKNQSNDGGIKKPMKPQVEDSIEFGEPFVKPAGKPGKVIKSSVSLSNSLD